MSVKLLLLEYQFHHYSHWAGVMEPVVLQPQEGQLGAIGRQDARADRNFFPAYLHLCRANGRRATDGWSLVCSVKVTGCQSINISSGGSSHSYLADSWVTDVFERVSTKASAATATNLENVGKYVLWEASNWFCFDDPVQFFAEHLPGKQMHPVLKVSEGLRGLMVGKGGTWHSQD